MMDWPSRPRHRLPDAALGELAALAERERHHCNLCRAYSPIVFTGEYVVDDGQYHLLFRCPDCTPGSEEADGCIWTAALQALVARSLLDQR